MNVAAVAEWLVLRMATAAEREDCTPSKPVFLTFRIDDLEVSFDSQ
jgi:hypothetical protein